MRLTSGVAGCLAAIGSAVYYIANRFPGLSFIDSGELALCSFTLGVPHPTGYPIYIILTRPITLFFNRPIEAATVFSALVIGLTVYVFFRICVLLLAPHAGSPSMVNLMAFCSSLVFAQAPVIAAQGTTNEVYGLSLLINLSIVWSLTRYLSENLRSKKTIWLYIIFYLTGLSLTNHLSAVMFLPLLAYLFWYHLRSDFSLRSILILVAFILFPLTLYLVLPIRAAANPPPAANWGGVSIWDNFYRHVTGWQYNVWMFSAEMSEIWQNLRIFVRQAWHQWPPLLWLFLPAGIYLAARRRGRWLILLTLIMGINIFLGINYSIPDIEGYYLVSVTLLGLLSLVGLIHLARFTELRWLPLAALVILLGWQSVRSFNPNYKGDYYLPEDYALNIGRSLEYHTVLISDIWDHQGQLYYLQQAEYFRPDARFIDMELLRRSWYYRLLESLYPELYGRIALLAGPFLAELRYFEGGDDYDASALERSYQKIINRLLVSDYPAYIDYGLNYTPGIQPYFRRQGLVVRVDTVESKSGLIRPKLIWRGRPLDEYTDWRGVHHVSMIRYFGY